MSQPLPRELRKSLEKTIMHARVTAEDAAKKRLNLMEVRIAIAPSYLKQPERHVRAGLRGLWKQLGEDDAAWQTLIEEVAYAQWHRLLFARFLLENNLLLHPEMRVPVTLAELKDLAHEAGERDAWTLAARYASAMLPGIFRQEDPAAQVIFAPEDRQELEGLVADLAPTLFAADDALGWVYQFWQAQRKAAINKSEVKIGAAEIAPVTQLFTEDYMVRFLLENSLGAWWAGKYPQSELLREFTYLRFGDDGRPAAGTFDGWPRTVAEVTVIDPCCGSGHFLVAAFAMLQRMRMEEEGLDALAATDAVLRDNLFGLEIDARCVQIAAFALALAAWKVSGYHQLPSLNVACSGIAAGGTREEWQNLAGLDSDETRNLRIVLGSLYDTFQNAPTLGSLIDPASVANEYKLYGLDYAMLTPLLMRALHKNITTDPVAAVFGDAAEGMLRAARLLAGKYTLVATNVPYLSSSKQGESLRKHCAKYYPDAKADLATTFLERIKSITCEGGSCVTVTAHNWLFIGAYAKLRKKILQTQTWEMVILLGTQAFQTPMWDFGIAMTIVTNTTPTRQHHLIGFDVSDEKEIAEKQDALRSHPIIAVAQHKQVNNPDARVIFSVDDGGKLLAEYAIAPQGIKTGDDDRWRRNFWELSCISNGWEFYQSTVKKNRMYGGREYIIDWHLEGRGMPCRRPLNAAIGHRGIAVSQMSLLPVTIYDGNRYDSNVGPIVPHDPAHMPAIWAFCSSPEYYDAVRRIDKKMNVTNATLVKVPFDLERWQRVADEMGPLPEPHSDDPTQWLFGGHPVGSDAPLHVALARLLGYHWPQQGNDDLDACAVTDGILCFDALVGQPAGVDRLRDLLVAAYGTAWTVSLDSELLAGTGGAARDLATWLRDEAAAQHNTLFHQRPFLWHIWDGRRDGFNAIVNYHRLDAATLRKLTYTYLGAWIDRQQADIRQGIIGAEPRLAAAQELQAALECIIEGKPPHDLFIRWKSLAQQPIGWEPDLNDGVRLNIRPFMATMPQRKAGKRDSGILRARPNITWGIDRGKNPDNSERDNDQHPTHDERRAAREQGDDAVGERRDGALMQHTLIRP